MAHLILVTRMRFKSSRDSRAAKGGAIGQNARSPPGTGSSVDSRSSAIHALQKS